MHINYWVNLLKLSSIIANTASVRDTPPPMSFSLLNLLFSVFFPFSGACSPLKMKEEMEGRDESGNTKEMKKNQTSPKRRCWRETRWGRKYKIQNRRLEEFFSEKERHSSKNNNNNNKEMPPLWLKRRKMKRTAADRSDAFHRHFVFGTMSIWWSVANPGAIHHDYAVVGR